MQASETKLASAKLEQPMRASSTKFKERGITMELSEQRLRTLSTLCDTFVPSVDRDDPDGYFRRKPTDVALPQIIAAALTMSPEADQRDVESLLDFLGSPDVGATWGGPPTAFADLAAEERERLLLAWQNSSVPELRASFNALGALVLAFYYGYESDFFKNPNYKSIGYSGPVSEPPKIERPIRPLVVSSDTVLDCDTVVVGSGAGGGVVAGELAEAGHDVIVVEKGPYVAEDGFTQREIEMTAQLYERGGALKTRDKAIAVLAGSCLGGGTTINWSGALRTPDYVREEWANEHGNPQFLSKEFDASMAAIEAATHVNTDETFVDAKGRLLVRGCEALGWACKLYPRNVKGCDPKVCGFCNFGCQRGAKQGTLKTYLQRAHDRGAKILAMTEVSRVVIEAGVARGVEAVQTAADGSKHRVSVRAKRVVVSAGSIHTPALLRRSGLSHAEIGKNLYIHPASGVAARYPDPVRAWSGSMMPVSCDQFARIDGNHGFKIVNAPLHPGFLIAVPWLSGADHKARMLESERIASFGAFVRERDTGRIEVDAEGQPIVEYWPSDYDMNHVLRGLQEAARLHLAAGAELIYLPGPVLFETRDGSAKLEALLAELRSACEPHRLFLMTAHQMGTCRMGGDAVRHPVTPEGETREVKNLFVADASVFPTCSGANPMPSIEAIAHYTSQGIKARA